MPAKKKTAKPAPAPAEKIVTVMALIALSENGVRYEAGESFQLSEARAHALRNIVEPES